MQDKSKTEYYFEGTGSNLAFAANGDLYSTVMTGHFENPDELVFHLDLVKEKTITRVFTFPAGAWINGITFDDSGNLFGADSRLGCIWKLTPDLKLSKWVEAFELTPQTMPGIPGANGIRFNYNAIWTVNSSKAEFLKIGISQNGSPEKIKVISTAVPGDGFAMEKTDEFSSQHIHSIR